MHSSHSKVYVGADHYRCSKCKVQDTDPQAETQCPHAVSAASSSPMNTLPSFMVRGEEVKVGQIWLDRDDNEVEITGFTTGDYPILGKDPSLSEDDEPEVLCFDNRGRSDEYADLKRLKDDGHPDYFDGYINVYANNETVYYETLEEARCASKTRKTLCRISVDHSRDEGIEDDE